MKLHLFTCYEKIIKKKKKRQSKVPHVSIPWVSKIFIFLKEILSCSFSLSPNWILVYGNKTLFYRRAVTAQGARGSLTTGRDFCCTSLGWSNAESMFCWQHLVFQGLVHCPELLLSGARLSLAGSSHSALGNRRQGTLFHISSGSHTTLGNQFPSWRFQVFVVLYVLLLFKLFFYLLRRSNMPRLTTVVK